jgi:hypothetical protein
VASDTAAAVDVSPAAAEVVPPAMRVKDPITCADSDVAA